MFFKKKSFRIKKWFDRPYLGLILLTTVSFFIAFNRYIVGGDYFIFTDAGSDCADEFYPMYMYLVDKIRNGEISLWNNCVGLGYDTLTRQERIMDPFAILTIFMGVLFGNQIVAPFLIFAHFLKIMLSAVLAYRFLDFFQISKAVKLIGAYIYAFNSFLIVWGQHYWFGAACIYILLLLIIVELWLKELEEGNKWMLVHSLGIAAVFCYSLYFAYMSVIVVSVYACIRIVYLVNIESKEKVKVVISSGIKMITALCIGAMIACIMVMPFIDNNVVVAARLSTDSLWDRILHDLLHPYEVEVYHKMLLRMVSSNVMGINSLGGTYYGLPLLSVSVVGLPFIVEGILCLYSKMDTAKKKLLYWISFASMIFVIFIPLGSSIFNVFQGSFGRYTFVLMPLFTLLFTIGLNSICNEKKFHFIIVGIIVLIEIGLLISAAFIFDNTQFIRSYIKYVIILNIIVYISVFLFSMLKKKIFILLVFVTIVQGTIAEAYVSSSSQERTTLEEFGINKRRNTELIIEKLKERDSSFFRIDKNYNDFRFLGDSLLEKLYLPTGYNSSINRNISEFYEKIWPEVKDSRTGTKVTSARGYIKDEDNLKKDNILALLGVKYILSDYKFTDAGSNWELIDNEKNDIYIYQNIQANSIITGYDKIITEKAFEEFSDEDRKKLIKSYLILSEEDIKKNEIGVDKIELSGIEKEKFDNEYTLELIKDTYFKGEIDTEKEKYFLISIPYRRGWKVYIDGENTSYLRGTYGFMAILIEEGKHLIEVRYENSIYSIGMIFSLIGIAIWLVLCKRYVLSFRVKD